MKRSQSSKTSAQRRPTSTGAGPERAQRSPQQPTSVVPQKFASPPCYLAEFWDAEAPTRTAK